MNGNDHESFSFTRITLSKGGFYRWFFGQRELCLIVMSYNCHVYIWLSCGRLTASDSGWGKISTDYLDLPE